MLLFKKILCPTDFSEPSYKALKAADELAKEFSSELLLIHVLEPAQLYPAVTGFAYGGPASGRYVPSEITSDIENNAAESLKMTLEEKISKEVNAKKELLKGNAAEEIARYAEKNDVSAIIMGTHGFTGWKHLIIGSVTEKVVRLSRCPVITIPADETK